MKVEEILKKVIGQNCSPEAVEQKCPSCGFDSNHILGAHIILSDSDECLRQQIFTNGNKIIIDGPRHVQYPSAYRDRNMAIVIRFACESGCRWAKVTQFHRGMVYEHNVDEEFKGNQEEAFYLSKEGE